MGRSCVVTRWKPELRWVATCGNSLPHTTFLRTHRPVRHLLICRAETQTVDLTYTYTLLCRSRVPATSVLPVTPPLLHFITRPRIPGQSSFRQGQPAGKAGQLESQAIHAAGNNVTINPAPVDDNLPHLSLSYHKACSGPGVISPDDQHQGVREQAATKSSELR